MPPRNHLTILGLLAAATLGSAGCNTSDPAYASSYEEGTGEMEDFDDCVCTVYTDGDMTVGCGDKFTLFPTKGTYDTLYRQNTDFAYSPELGDSSYFGGGFGIFAISPPYPDPRNADYAFQYHSFYIETYIAPAQTVCDPINPNDCVELPASSVRGVTLYCSDLGTF